MTKTRLLYIVNPISGTNRKRDFAAIADAYTDKNRFDFQTVYTERAGHASELARQAAAEGIDIVARTSQGYFTASRPRCGSR